MGHWWAILPIHSSYIWVWKSEAVVYSLILLVTLGVEHINLGRTNTIDKAAVAMTSSRMGAFRPFECVELAGIADVLKDCKRGTDGFQPAA